MRHLARLCAIGLGFLASTASATVIDFNQLNAQSSSYVFGAYQEDGYTLTSSACVGLSCFYKTPSSQSIDPAGTSLSAFDPTATVTFAKTDGGLFTLESLKLSEFENESGLASILFSFVDQNGASTSQTVSLNLGGNYVAQLASFNTGPLRSFSFNRPAARSAKLIQFDDIVVNAAAVPEPATWAMLLVGFGTVGSTMRRRRIVRTSFI